MVINYCDICNSQVDPQTMALGEFRSVEMEYNKQYQKEFKSTIWLLCEKHNQEMRDFIEELRKKLTEKEK